MSNKWYWRVFGCLSQHHGNYPERGMLAGEVAEHLLEDYPGIPPHALEHAHKRMTDLESRGLVYRKVIGYTAGGRPLYRKRVFTRTNRPQQIWYPVYVVKKVLT